MPRPSTQAIVAFFHLYQDRNCSFAWVQHSVTNDPLLFPPSALLALPFERWYENPQVREWGSTRGSTIQSIDWTLGTNKLFIDAGHLIFLSIPREILNEAHVAGHGPLLLCHTEQFSMAFRGSARSCFSCTDYTFGPSLFPRSRMAGPFIPARLLCQASQRPRGTTYLPAYHALY